MASVQNSVAYCCVTKSGQFLFTYNGGGPENDNLAALCLEMTPPYHKWYFQTMGKRTFGFLMDDGYVYFALVNESVGKSGALRFLERLRDEFRKVGRSGGSFCRIVPNLSSPFLQEQLFPVVRRLVERASGTGTEWPADNASQLLYPEEVSPSPVCNSANGYGHAEIGSSTKAPLLGKPSKQDKKKKKVKDHVIAMRVDVEMEEHRRSTERVVKADSVAMDSINQGGALASPSRKDFNLTRIKSGSQNLRKKWCQQVKIVLAIDAAVCIVLFVIWLVICHGTKCIS